jgi:hypothetical protein
MKNVILTRGLGNGQGGAIQNNGGTLTINNSTISGNSAGMAGLQSGGGIFGLAPAPDQSATCCNSQRVAIIAATA